ncbi:MAG: efflux RND transporter periplasmic adaptor subunit [Anaerolineae bacterium]|nr:efflux RND transporter periplasmic adaptor subunit [Anaerolineae bacterium]
MRRWVILFIVLALALVGGAGYLGTHSAQSRATSAAQAPTTVEVTRGNVQQTVTAPGQLVATHQVTLSAGVSGQIAEVPVRAGEPVQAGEVLVQLDPAPLAEKIAAAKADLGVARAQWVQLQAGPTAAELAAAELALARAEADLGRLRAGPTAAEVATARAGVAAAEKDLAALESAPDPRAVAQAQAELERAAVVVQQAQAAYDQVRDRADVGLLPQSLALQQATIAHRAARAAFEAASRPAAEAEVAAARARLAAMRAALAQLEAGPSKDEVHLAELQVAKAETDLAQLRAGLPAAALAQAEIAVQAAERALNRARADLAAATLRAPFDGVVVAVEAHVGEIVLASGGLVVLTEPAALEIETSVVEEDLPLVQAGQEVTLFFDAWPEGETEGHVARIVPQRLPGDRPLYPVYITLDDVLRLPEGLVAGMTVDASIFVASRDDVLRLPRALVQARGDGTATVQVWTGSGIEERLVHTGQRGDVYIEIVDGLREGEEVVSQ